ncbi:replication initiator protein A [Fusobacterium polymorphum]
MEEKEPYFQVPKSLFRSWRAGEINSTAFAVYMLMLDRYKISYLKENRKNFTDENGKIFFVYAYNSLMEDLNIVRKNEIAKAIQELEKLGFIRSLKKHGKATKYYITSNLNDTTTSNLNDTLIRINNKNNINKNNINNNNKENVVSGVIRQEIKFLIKTRNIKIENILKYCSDIERIKEVFRYADKYNKADGWIIACFRDNYTLKQEENNQNQEKDYDITIDEALKRSRKKR